MHAAFLIKGGAVINTFNNTAEAHAEIRVLRGSWYGEPKGCTLLSVRINKRGNLVNARPCKDCWSQMQKYGIRTVFYSTAEGTIVRERVSR